MGVEIQLFEVGAYRSDAEVPLAERMRVVFQHDGAPAHYSRLVTNLLKSHSP
jgi:hypothetical protein